MKELSHLNKYLLRYKGHLLLGVLFVALSNIFAIVPAQLVGHALNLVTDALKTYPLFQGSGLLPVFREGFFQVVFFYGMLIVGMALVRGVFLYLMRQTIIVMSRLIEYDMKNEIFAHYQSLPLSFYRKNNTGDLMARISEDVGKVRMYIGPAIMYGVNLTVTFVLIIGYMLAVNPALTFYALLPLPLLSLSIYWVNSRIDRRSELIQRQLSSLSTFVQETFSGIRVLKSFVREPDSVQQMDGLSEEYRQRQLSLSRVNALFYPLMQALIGLSVILTVYKGGMLSIEGKATPGLIAEFIMYVTMLTWPVTSLGWVTSIVQRAAASQRRINEFMETRSEIISGQLNPEVQGHLRFQDVTLVYPDSGIRALDGVSFEVRAGQALAILGSTGSGKSTIANLLCRMYDPSSGQVLLDERPLPDYQLSHLRQQMGYVPQDVFLFSDTLAHNIAFGQQQASDEQIVQAAKDADLWDNIQALDKGLQTVLGERGISLSGGQKQRASIARAIIRQPKVLILDDCLSAVDTNTENVILHNLERIMAGRTTVIISHRVSSAKLADHILVLDKGQVIERGTHEQLLEKGGFYKELYDKQLKSSEQADNPAS